VPEIDSAKQRTCSLPIPWTASRWRDTPVFVSPEPNHQRAAEPHLGRDDSGLGTTWAQYDLKEFGRRSPCRFHRKNGEGWFRVDLRSGWVTPAEMLFIKPKESPGASQR
jgi:hypothetical protein